MKVAAINASPRKTEGQTALILNPFVEGMRDAGASVDVVCACELKIRPCDGDFSCWWGTPGACRYRDDMDWLLPLLREAEVWVLGMPVFLPMPGEAQNLLNRTVPLFTSSLRVEERRMYPARCEDLRLEKIALVSSCGYWEMENFDKLVHVVREIAEASAAEFVAPLLRPHATVLAEMASAGADGAVRVIAAARDAGRQLVTEGVISQAACDAVAMPLQSFDEYLAEWRP